MSTVLPKAIGPQALNFERYTGIEVVLIHIGVVENADAKLHVFHGDILEKMQGPRIWLQHIPLKWEDIQGWGSEFRSRLS